MEGIISQHAHFSMIIIENQKKKNKCLSRITFHLHLQQVKSGGAKLVVSQKWQCQSLYHFQKNSFFYFLGNRSCWWRVSRYSQILFKDTKLPNSTVQTCWWRMGCTWYKNWAVEWYAIKFDWWRSRYGRCWYNPVLQKNRSCRLSMDYFSTTGNFCH